MKKYKLGVEIGCGDRYSSELVGRFAEFEQIKLIEPNKILYHDIATAPNPHDNIVTANFAISELDGEDKFYGFGYCSFLHNASSFLNLSCEDDAFKYWAPLSYFVKCQKMSSIDKGDIDYLILTCQGSEMFVLEDMISRPQIIRTKYYCHNAKHWQHSNQITAWMMKNGYTGRLIETNLHNTFMHIEFTKN